MNHKQAVGALAALAQTVRLAVFRELVQAGPDGLAASAIAEKLDVAPSTLSFHLKELTHAGLIVPKPVGRFILYSAHFGAMNGLVGYLTENCCGAPGAAAACCGDGQP
jgi:DNA-binding transcriptional ArsR family regulator